MITFNERDSERVRGGPKGKHVSPGKIILSAVTQNSYKQAMAY